MTSRWWMWCLWSFSRASAQLSRGPIVTGFGVMTSPIRIAVLSPDVSERRSVSREWCSCTTFGCDRGHRSLPGRVGAKPCFGAWWEIAFRPILIGGGQQTMATPYNLDVVHDCTKCKFRGERSFCDLESKSVETLD